MCPADAAGLPTDTHLSTLAVVVSWQPDTKVLGELLAKLVAQQCQVVIIDNGSSNIEALNQLIAAISHNTPHNTPHDTPSYIRLISWPDNRGLATALNEGLRHAQSKGCELAFMFDQDSRIGETFCDAMTQAWQKALAVSPQPVAAIGPRLQDPQSDRKTPFRKFSLWQRTDRLVSMTTDLYDTDFIITSGTLLSLPALKAIGDMKDDYFIDNIDLEWCFRARANGYSLYGTDATCLFHRIGEPSKNPLVNAGVMVKHSPLRSYYSTRNRLHLWRQEYAPLDWKMRDILRFTIKAVWLILFSGQGRDYWREIMRGIRDARTLT